MDWLSVNKVLHADESRAMSQESVELMRRGFDAFNRRDRAAWLELAHPELVWVPPADWPENAPVSGHEAVWDFAVSLSEPWEEGSYELGELIADQENDVVAVHVSRRVRGKGSGVEAEFQYWLVGTFRDGKFVRTEWFADRGDALEAAGLSE